MVAMNNRKWRLQSHQESWLKQKYKISLQLELWGETEVITSKSGEIEVFTSERNCCL